MLSSIRSSTFVWQSEVNPANTFWLAALLPLSGSHDNAMALDGTVLGLSRCRQLHKICFLPDFSITPIGTGNRTVWVKKKLND